MELWKKLQMQRRHRLKVYLFDKDVGHVQEELCMPLDCRES